MTNHLAEQLGISRKKCSVPIGTLNKLHTVANNIITATIKSRINDCKRSLTFLTIPTIASLIPEQPIERSCIKIPKNIKLADPNFDKPAPIDLLLGAGVALSLLCVGQINLLPDGPDLYLQKTRFGWVIGGSAPTIAISKIKSNFVTTQLNSELNHFWELEEGPKTLFLSDSEKRCEEYFKSTVTRNNEGRYTVALPFNDKLPRLGESKTQALKRLISLEHKLDKNPELRVQYHAVLQEYLDLGHMTEILENSFDGYYLPHHCVSKLSSDTTKLRVVFDGSAATSTGISLNDVLDIGRKLQDDLVYILLRFRIHNYIITGDIEKMYRQFLVRAEDRKYQRILWRDSSGRVKTYELNTVTFGLSSAPYLAIRCLNQLAEDEQSRYPIASRILLRDFYVDDALTGASTIHEALSIREELSQLLKSAGLNIRQWASNNKQILHGLSEQEINKKLHLGESSTLKTLGIVWDSANDSVIYSVKTVVCPSAVTKRFISSEIAKIYDPLGLLGPVIIIAKIILQRIWTLKIDWDESLPLSIHTEWSKFYNQLPLLNEAKFSRKTLIDSPMSVELHGFCDSSERAYGACVYLKSTNAYGQTFVELLTAKSKVAPLKSQTIPRLELCGALLLTSLISTVQKALHISINRAIYWTDSTIVLHWLRTSPHLLQTFVANRVAQIQSQTQILNWRHIPTADNPADLISRGQQPKEFLQATIWHKGPAWLQFDESCWPNLKITPPSIIPEQKSEICFITATLDTAVFDNYSSWNKMIRITAYCLRWRNPNKKKVALTLTEFNHAHDVLIKLLQQIHFISEIRRLYANKNSNIQGKLQKLNPFLDDHGILRVGGRLKHSSMPYSQKHPIILPKSRITRLIIEQEHRIQLHSGIQNTLYAIRRRYWPIDGRSQVGKTVRNCIRCCRAKPPLANYVMGNLPEARVTESRPFSNVGVDYCGPFFIKERRHKNRTKIKVYVAVFVCLAVKAVHLELVSDLSTDAFIAALRRFIARRGYCASIHSDNGTNFIGANNELRELRELLNSEDHNRTVQNFLAERNIEWNFIPPLAPHFGGLWEAAVKSFKHHLRRIVGSELFTFENFNTLIIEIESILNSRPLTPISSDPNDPLVITPGHFLIGESLTCLRERDFKDVPANRLSGWQHIQKLKQHFWTRWHKEYLNELTSRNKWSSGNHSIKEGSIVLLREDNTPPMQWPFGRVIKVHPGTDNVIRAVTVKTATSILDRSIRRLVPLPIQPTENIPAGSTAIRGSRSVPVDPN